jgi:hypothetical protein
MAEAGIFSIWGRNAFERTLAFKPGRRSLRASCGCGERSHVDAPKGCEMLDTADRCKESLDRQIFANFWRTCVGQSAFFTDPESLSDRSSVSRAT